MAKGFTSEEKVIIYNKLLECGKDYIGKYGVKRTSVDDVVREVGISKGAFYKFFESKELFALKVMEKIDQDLKVLLVSNIPCSRENFREELIENLYNFTNELTNPVYAKVISQEEINYITRSLPEKDIRKYLNNDDSFGSKVLDMISSYIEVNNVDADIITGMLKVLILTIQNEEIVGISIKDKIVRFQVEAIVNYICI